MRATPHHRAWPWIGLSLGTAFLLAGLLFWAGLRPAAAQEPLEVSAAPTTIQAGESAVFTVTLTNPANTTRTLVLSTTLSGPVEQSRFQFVPEESQGVNTQNTSVRGETFLWRGQMAAGGKLTIRVDVRSGIIGVLVALDAAAGPALDNLLLNARGEVSIEQPPTVNPGQIVLSKIVSSLATDDELVFDTGNGVEVLSGDTVRARTVISNNSASKIFALVTDALQPAPASTARIPSNEVCQTRIVGAQVVNGEGSPIPNGALNQLQADYAFVVAIEAGAAAVVEAQVQAIGGLDCTLQGLSEVRVRSLPPGFSEQVMPQAKLVRSLAVLPPSAVLPLTWAVVASDFGDAPDSKYQGYASFFSMMAYLSPITEGNFPTAYYSGKPTPQGPKHRFVNPLHLGDGFSLERWADRGPRRNIDPVTLTADLDVNDDGIDPAALSLQHCIPTSIPFRVTMRQDALDRMAEEGKTARLNIWLDGNRDGDWGDWLDCDGIQAPEHIVIDQAITPSSGGVYDLVAVTGNLPIPQSEVGKDMWLRISLSDEPSVKTLATPSGTAYGDGRGSDNGFRLGETEDYLIIPAGAATGRGLDLALHVDVRVLREPSFPTLDSRMANLNKPTGIPFITQRVRIQNLGGLTAGGKLVLEMDPFLGGPTISGGSWYGCITCTVVSRKVDQITAPVIAESISAPRIPFVQVCPAGEACRLELEFDALRAGQFGDLIMGWKVEEGTKVSFKTRIETPSADAKPENNAFETEVGASSILPLNLLSPRPGLQAVEGLTESHESLARLHIGRPITATVKFSLFGHPNAVFKIIGNGQDLREESFNSQGLWRGSVDVPTGDLRLGLVYKSVPGYSEGDVQSVIWIEEMLPFQFTSALAWNPGTIRARPGLLARAEQNNGPAVGRPIVDAAGLSAADEWRLPVRPGQPTAVDVDLLCHQPGGGAALRMGDGAPIVFSDPDSDGRFTANFTPSSVNGQTVKLIVGCNDDGTSRFAPQSRSAGSVEFMLEEEPACANYAQCWVFSGVLEEIPTATIVDGVSGEPIQGAAVQLWHFRRNADGIQAQAWPGEEFAQQNPITTGADGRFGFSLNPGFYGVTIAAPGYQPMRIGPARLCCHWSPDTIRLQPIPAGAPTHEVIFTDDGFNSSRIQVTPGSLVSFQNLSLGFTSFEEGSSAAARANGSRSSGLLTPGESYLADFAEAGSYTFVNTQNPTQQIVVVVEQAESGYQLFLPTITAIAD